MPKYFRKLFLLSVFVLLILVSFTALVKADVVVFTQDWKNSCKTGEIEKDCSFSYSNSYKNTGIRTNDKCMQYSHDSNYYLLAENTTIRGGNARYCHKINGTDPINLLQGSPLILPILFTVVFCLLAIGGAGILIWIRHSKKGKHHANT